MFTSQLVEFFATYTYLVEICSMKLFSLHCVFVHNGLNSFLASALGMYWDSLRSAFDFSEKQELMLLNLTF